MSLRLVRSVTAVKWFLTGLGYFLVKRQHIFVYIDCFIKMTHINYPPGHETNDTCNSARQDS